MTNIIFIDENNSSRQNGIGTFRDQLLPRLGLMAGIRLTLLSMNCDVLDMQRQKRPFGTEYLFPHVGRGDWRACGPLICPILRTIFKDSARNVFVINHSPCIDFIVALRESFPLSRVLFVIHDQGWCTPLLGSKQLLRRIMIDNETPENVSLGRVDATKTYCRNEKAIYDAVDGVVCLSPSTRDLLETVYGVEKSKIHMIPNGFSPLRLISGSKNKIRKELGLNVDETILIFAGRPAEYKGIESTLKSLVKLSSDRPLRCVFCGDMAGFGSFGKVLGPVAAKVIFTGLLAKDDLYKWYKAADLGLMPSYSEQFGYSAIEMVNCGLPLIVSDGNGLCDMFEDGENAFVAHIGDVNNKDEFAVSLAAKIRQALTSAKSDIERIKQCALHNVTEKYSANLMAERYAALCRRIAG